MLHYGIYIADTSLYRDVSRCILTQKDLSLLAIILRIIIRAFNSALSSDIHTVTDLQFAFPHLTRV